MIDYGEDKKYAQYGYQPPEAAPVPEGNNLSGVAKIKVIGVGGAGNNAVDRLIESGLKSAEYIVVNTDNQALARSKARNRVQIGVKLTKGLGAGADPTVGRAAAEENKDALQNALKDTDLLFIAAGMGGGTGTGAAPVIAKLAKDMKILTIAVVTLPFTFEAKRRMDNALAGVEELAKFVDAIITIPNDKIQQVVPKGTSFTDALKVADEVLRQGIRGIAELIVKSSLINLDFADVKTTLKGKGLAHMGIGVAKGEKRISDAVRCAVCSPLLNTTIEGASSVILNVIGGKDLTFDEVAVASDLVRGIIDYSANLIFGACIDENMSDEVEVVIIATGFNDGHPTGNMDRATATQKASDLSKRINYAYYDRMSGPQGGEQNAPYYPQNDMNGQYQPRNAYNAPMQQSYANNGYSTSPYGGATQSPYMPQQQQPYAPATPYGAPMNYPQAEQEQPIAPQQPMSFEPDDPIPDTSASKTEYSDRKHRPRFVDFFMKKNSDEHNDQ
ncbi:MAG: cell division protein FtsZ [Clostridia bacterium]|nr:cell division protein FtsZ [Clostridia bacterium]